MTCAVPDLPLSSMPVSFSDAARAAFVHDAVHRVGDFFDGGFGNREAFFADVLRIFQQVRLLEDSRRKRFRR